MNTGWLYMKKLIIISNLQVTPHIYTYKVICPNKGMCAFSHTPCVGADRGNNPWGAVIWGLCTNSDKYGTSPMK